jgi:hypothetical protein
MTSVPKPLKFLRPFYEELGKIRRVWHASMVEERVSLVSGLHLFEGEYGSRFEGIDGIAGSYPLHFLPPWFPTRPFPYPISNRGSSFSNQS